MRIALYQPDIPQNLGNILRLAACMAVPVDIIEPCGFPLDDKKIRRAGMDYIAYVESKRHASFDAFMTFVRSDAEARLVLYTTKAEASYTHFSYQPKDIMLFGRETAGVPEEVVQQADARVLIPMRNPLRSLNLATSVAMGVGEALRQLSL